MKFSQIQYSRPNLDQVCPAYDALTARLLAARTPEEALACVNEHEALSGAFTTAYCYAYIRHTIDTTDAFYDGENDFFDQALPLYREKLQDFDKALVQGPFAPRLVEVLGETMFKNIELSLKAFSPEIIPQLQQENALTSRYEKLLASASIELDGKLVNLSQIRKQEQDADREARKRAYAAESGFDKENEAELDQLFDQLVALRHQMARTLGYEDYVTLAYYNRVRNCFDQAMAESFRRQVAEDFMPLVKKVKARQAKRLGLQNLFFYDNGSYFLEGNPQPQGDVVEKAGRMYREMSPDTAEFADYMLERELLDVMAKPGKAPGGYCIYLPDYKMPFIYSNFNGTTGDVDVMTHEAGHAFNAYLCRNFPYGEWNDATMETAEIHSMAMEFFAHPWLELFYGADADRVRSMHLEDAIGFIPYGCMVDEFQHLVYRDFDASPAQRKAMWRELEGRYRPFLEFGDFPFFSEGCWFMRQTHIYCDPFYYIDYCLAQTVALQFFVFAQENRRKAFEVYVELVKKGGKFTFVELVEQAGLKSPFEEGCLKELAGKLEKYLLGDEG